MRVATAVILLGASLVAASGPAHAFGTVNVANRVLGQRAEHERITRLGLRSIGLGRKTMSEIAGEKGTFGAVGAPDNPLRGLMGRKEAHCDGADHLAGKNYPQSRSLANRRLGSCRDWVFRHLQQAVAAAGEILDGSGGIRSSQIPTIISCTYNGKRGRAKCNVLEALGLALHASQDFYSHTNWTDRAAEGPVSVTNPPGLGQDGPAPFIDPSRQRASASDIISGCYDGFPESRHCAGRVKHESLNKDNGPIDVRTGSIGAGSSPRGRINGNFARAVRAAIEDTRDKWRYFEAQVRARYGAERGRRIICAIRNDDPGRCG